MSTCASMPPWITTVIRCMSLVSGKITKIAPGHLWPSWPIAWSRYIAIDTEWPLFLWNGPAGYPHRCRKASAVCVTMLCVPLVVLPLRLRSSSLHWVAASSLAFMLHCFALKLLGEVLMLFCLLIVEGLVLGAVASSMRMGGRVGRLLDT